MNETSLILIAAIIFAIAMDFGLIYLLRGFLSEDKNGPRATFLGAYSPFLTWLHYHRLPRTRLKLPSFFQYIPWKYGQVLYRIFRLCRLLQLLIEPAILYHIFVLIFLYYRYFWSLFAHPEILSL